MNDYFCEFSNTFDERSARHNPSVPNFMLVKKGLKTFVDGIRIKKISDEIILSKSVARIINLNIPILLVGLLEAGMEKFVMGGK
jgi:hypothetical protein